MQQSLDVPKQNPFSLYDIIGYFIPGSIFLFLCLLFKAENSSNIIPFVKGLCETCGTSAVSSIILFLIFFSISYALGQVISILSNIIVEGSTFCSHHNYLYYIFLKKCNINLIPKKGCNLFNILLFYILIYEKIFEMFGAEGLRHKDSLDEIRVSIIKKSVVEILNKFYKHKEVTEENISDLDLSKNPPSNYFELLYHYVFERATHHLYKIQNYVALYGFMRNMCMVFCLLFWVSLTFVVLHYLFGTIKLLHPTWNVISMILYSFLSFVTIIGIHKYKKRYTLEVLHAAATLRYKYDESLSK